jgi:predicted outer membrane repeat protein
MREWTFGVGLLIAAAANSPAAASGHVTLCHFDQETGVGTNFAAAMVGGGGVTFGCPARSVIRLSHPYQLYDSINIDGGGHITLDAAGGRMFVGADESVHLTLGHLTLENALDTGPIPLRGFAYLGSVVSGPMTVEMEEVTVRNSKHPIDVDSFRVNHGQFSKITDVVVRVGVLDAQNTDFACDVRSFPFAFRGTTSLAFDNVSVTGCGRIWSYGGTTIKRSRFVNNQLGPNESPGAAVHIGDGEASIEKSQFVNNSAAGGGAIYISGGKLKLRRVDFISNTSTGTRGGGAILAELDATSSNSIVIEAGHTSFRDNKAENGGAVAIENSSTHPITFSSDAMMFYHNSANGRGGAFSLDAAGASFGRAMFVQNEARQGGAIAGGSRSSVMLANSLLVRNLSREGGAFVGPALKLTNVTVAANRGVAIVGRSPGERSDIVLSNSIVANNPDGNCASLGSRVVDNGHNLQDRDASCGITIPMADPQLDDQFYVPHPLSPARRAGDNATCLAAPISARDVYGEMRPQGEKCTIGAVEGTVSRYALRHLRDTPEGRLDRDLVVLRRLVWPDVDRREPNRPPNPGKPGRSEAQ